MNCWSATEAAVKALAAICILLSLLNQALADEHLLLIRMPDEPALPEQPGESDVARFFAMRESHLHMTLKDLLKDREFARQVLGQRQIFDELGQFQTERGIPVKVKFITWADAFRYFADYVSDANNPPIVAQIGDTWAAYFRSLGVMPYEQRHTWDVRLLWYWRDLVDAKEVTDGSGFISTCQRLQAIPSTDLIAPFAIPTAPDWNMLHDLSVWLYNAGLSSLISTDKKFGIIPWKQAIFDGPEGERAARFLIELTERGCVALPEKTSNELAEDFLARKYAMVILGPWVAERAEKRLGPDWTRRIGATLPPRIGANSATTFKGGSLLVVLDPTRGRDAAGVARARLLVDFLSSPESQWRYSRALGALPANQQALARSPHFELFKTALERGKTYPQIPEWAPVVENLATRDNLYAFWKRLSLLTSDANSAAGPSELEARERLILAALHSAAADINSALSPGRVSFLWPWFIAVSLLLSATASILAWHRYRERKRIRELREARDALATLQRRLEAMRETAINNKRTAPLEAPTAGPAILKKSYPALYLDTLRRKVLLKKDPSHPLEEIIHGAEFDLFRHIIECLQVGWYETHWIWGYVIWPTAQPKFPKESFATHCTKLRKRIEKSWQLGKMLGRGSHHDGSIPIEVRDVHFYTDARAENDAHPIWELFQTSEQAFKAYKTGRVSEARALAEQLLRLDQDNWSGNFLLCKLAAQKIVDPNDPLIRRAIEFARRQKIHYEQAIEKIEGLPDEKMSSTQKERMRSRLESLSELLAQLPELPIEAPSALDRKPWRTRDQLNAWVSYLNGRKGDLPGQEIRIIEDLQRFVIRRLHWADPQETACLFREFVQDLALDTKLWPDDKLPASEKALKYRALDYVLAGVCHLSDDDESKATTKARKLRRLWNTRAHLRRRLEREPTIEELYLECQQQHGWSRLSFEHLLRLESACRPSQFDESYWEEPLDFDH
ncbi:ABC-type sugar transport system, periplasmic component [Pyrinomonas methylaliphatogenes]|uniref:ABC-type sugar transport system, periplasmic component n=2 Tax=Pyrinomonas methylaliphatogenes TaxID=454194 RepID=A0A0B6WW41_9BACT|nr:ABC-type sugar transport system, periplasmic component [Pyrinomonas methylaliphatogenes]